MATALTIDLPRARAFWFRRQGLAQPAAPTDDLAAVIARTGWVRTLGGADVYLAMRARVVGLGRAPLEAAVAASAVRVIPAVRGCIYLVPAADVPWALRVAEDAWRPRTEREVAKVGAAWKEVEQLAAAAERALAGGPLGTDAIRRALPDGAVRSLGDAGKKLGMSSLLPVALRVLEFADRIERTLDGGRLDTERYTWRIVRTPPAAGARLADAAARRARLAETFLGHAGPATLAHFASWSALSQRDAKAAIESIDAVPVRIDGVGDAFVLARDVAALERAAPAPAAVALLSFEDNYLTFHGGPGVVSDPAHHAIPVDSWGSSRPSTLGAAGHVALRTIVVGGLVVGFWELDAAARAGVWAPLGPGVVPAAAVKTIDAQVADAARFLVDELGHGKSFTLDTADAIAARAARITALRAAPSPAPRARAASAKPAARAARATAAARAPAARRGSTKRARPRTRGRG